ISVGAGEADRTAHAGPAQSAVTTRVLGEVLLVVVLGVEERRRCDDLRGDRRESRRVELLLEHLARRLGRVELRAPEAIDPGAVLRADVVPLAHALGRIVVLPEHA